MLRGRILHPQVLAGLAMAGHGAKVLIADANYPTSTKSGARATIVYLNLAPGVVSAIQAVEAVADLIVIESAFVMAPDQPDRQPSIWSEYERAIGVDLQKVGRSSFYDLVSGDDAAMVIVTGETQLFANLLLGVGAIA